ncbi:ubiquitin-conjugating enzyme E2 R2 [Cebus imitator]|nr:ubiquitin-conjugating enzyme E2 R2 [Cebus imitator]
MAQQQMTSSQKALMLELKSLQEEPVEGFRITLVDESDLYNWEVAIFGPPNTLYEGGYFKAHIKFPIDYPYSPPTFRFLTKMWHPNIYENGDVCISILHPPVDDPQSGELPSERWNPTQNVRSSNSASEAEEKDSAKLSSSKASIAAAPRRILPHPRPTHTQNAAAGRVKAPQPRPVTHCPVGTFSPANVDASVMFRKWRDSKGKDKEYAEIIRKQVSATKAEAEKDGVKVPTTLAEYCIKTKVPSNDNSSDLLYDDLYDDDIDDEDEEEEDADCYDDDDSGNEES